MTDLKIFQYIRMLEERRGHNYQYPNYEQQQKNDKLGYKHHFFGRDWDTRLEDNAKEIVNEYRKKGYFSRIVCYPNEIIGMKYFTVIYRKKKTIKLLTQNKHYENI